VRQGEDIQVVEQATERDRTSTTLAQIIFEEEKRTPRLSIDGLRRIIRTGLPTDTVS
jgi:polyhydroxyalkanoate synthesis regulator protein